MALVAVLALPALSQAPKSRIKNIEMTHARAARQPYTAEYKITRVKTLGDGSTITQESTEVVAMDSEGRRMTATTTVPLSGDQTPVTHVSVNDPEARTNSNWSVPGHEVRVTMPTPGLARGCGRSATSLVPMNGNATAAVRRARPTVEDLGTETIQGIEAHGRRTTTTTPVGALGNNEPLVNSTEIWTAIAPGLPNLIVREATDDPRMGKMSKELVSFSQSEPDSTVFQPPPDYEIVTREALSDPCQGIGGVESPSPAPESPQ
jgi:hypothetical protein